MTTKASKVTKVKAAVKIKRPPIPVSVKVRLWTASAGRCQFDGCNKSLWRNDLTMEEMNIAYIAHIHAFSPLGPRYHSELSPKLEKDFSNLMLVCDSCHRTFDDKQKEKEYPADRLLTMKKDHENRIELLTSIAPEKKSHVVLFGARIGEHSSPLSFTNALQAMVPDNYPASPHAAEIGLKNSSFEDNDTSYWAIETEHLQKSFKEKVQFIKETNGQQHYSIFALAPQPLLIKLGTLLSDLYQAEIFQLHREPYTWKWLDEISPIDYHLVQPSQRKKNVALKIELSATIVDERIISIIGDDTSIWSIRIANPGNDYLRTRRQLQDFRTMMRKAFDLIKATHGEHVQLHLFPAMPVAAAVELGRVWMPKADLPIIIYDQNRKLNGFAKAIEINRS